MKEPRRSLRSWLFVCSLAFYLSTSPAQAHVDLARIIFTFGGALLYHAILLLAVLELKAFERRRRLSLAIMLPTVALAFTLGFSVIPGTRWTLI